MRMLLICTTFPNWWIARYWKMTSHLYLIVLIGLRERVLDKSPSRAGLLNLTQHLCQQMMQKMQLTNGKKIRREIGISFGGIVRAMLMDAALLMEVPLTILDVLMAFCDLW